MTVFWQVLLAGVFSAVSNMIGIYLMLRNTGWTRTYGSDIMAFAAGVLVGSALLHFGPELAAHAPSMVPWTVVSFFGLYTVEHHFAPHFHVTPEEETHALRPEIGLITALGFGFHSVFDGLAIGVGFAFDRNLGLVAALAVLVHEIPEGIATFTALLHSGHGERRATRYALVVALITPLVAFLSFWFVNGLSAQTLGLFLALATGSLLYIGATDLLPEAAHAGGWRKTFLIALGLALIYALTFLGHGHGT